MHSLNLMEVQGVASGSSPNGATDTIAATRFDLYSPGSLPPCLVSVGHYLLDHLIANLSLNVNGVTELPMY